MQIRWRGANALQVKFRSKAPHEAIVSGQTRPLTADVGIIVTNVARLSIAAVASLDAARKRDILPYPERPRDEGSVPMI